MRPAFTGLRSGQPNPVVCGRKFCSKCGRWRLVAIDFDIQRTNGNRLRSWCRTCQRLVNREVRARRTEKQRELRREYQRIWMEARRRKQGVPPRRFDYSPDNPRRRTTPIDRVERVLLPREPLVREIDWWLSEGEHSVVMLVRISGVQERVINRIRSGEHSRVRLDVADRLLVAMRVPLALVYPDERQEAA